MTRYGMDASCAKRKLCHGVFIPFHVAISSDPFAGEAPAAQAVLAMLGQGYVIV